VQTRTRNAITFGVAAALAGGGLAAVAKLRTRPDLSGHAVDAIPSGALLVATADLGALRASPAGAPFLREGREIPGLGKVKDVCGFDPMDTLTEVAIAIPAAGETGEFGLVAAGPVDADAVVACASKVIQARGGNPVVTAIGAFRSVRDASLAITGGEIAVRKGGPLLLGAGSYLRAMIDAADGRAPNIRSSRAHGFLGSRVGDASVRVTVVLSPEQRRTLADELALGGATGSPAASIVGGGLGVTLGPSVALHAVISCDDAAACGRLAASLKQSRDARAADFATRMVGFGAVLEKISIESEGELVQARVDLPADQAASLAERLLALRGMRHPMPSAEGSAAPRAPAPPPDEVLAPDAGARKGPPPSGSAAPSAPSARPSGAPKNDPLGARH
jgi:hypothetical protein